MLFFNCLNFISYENIDVALSVYLYSVQVAWQSNPDHLVNVHLYSHNRYSVQSAMLCTSVQYYTDRRLTPGIRAFHQFRILRLVIVTAQSKTRKLRLTLFY